MMVHTNAKRRRRPGTRRADKAGVPPARIVIAHAGDSDDLGYLRAIADTGASLGCDRFNIGLLCSRLDPAQHPRSLLPEGYGDRVHLAHDASAFFDVAVGNPLFADEVLDYLHISRRSCPRCSPRA